MKPQFPLKKLLFLVINFIISFVLLRIIIEVSERTGMLWIYITGACIYAALIIGLFLAYFVLNGYTFNKEPLTACDLSDKLTDEQKADFLAKQPERKEKAQKLLLVLFPLILTFAISYIELYIIG